MNKQTWRVLWGLPWVAMVVLGALYLGELAREMAGQGWQAGNSIFHFGIMAVLVFVAGLVIDVLQQEALSSGMSERVRRMLFWTPRTAALLFTILIGLLALDVFSEAASFGNMLLGFLVHLIPALILLAGVVLAWRREWLGALVFIGWAGWYVLQARGFPASVYVEVALLPFLLGILFLLNWRYRAELKL